MQLAPSKCRALTFAVLLICKAAVGQSAPSGTNAIPPILATPTRVIELNSHAEWRARYQVEFDSQGRVIVLYRDNLKQSPTGNWHLIRFADIWVNPKRDELVFAPIEEPTDPDKSRIWEGSSVNMQITPDSSTAYVIFRGEAVTSRTGPRKRGGVRNVDFRPFTNAVSVDLSTLTIVAKRDLTGEPHQLDRFSVDEKGRLVRLQTNERSWNVHTLSPGLNLDATTEMGLSTGPIPSKCQVEVDTSINCREAEGLVRRTSSGTQTLIGRQGSGIPGWFNLLSIRNSVIGQSTDETAPSDRTTLFLPDKTGTLLPTSIETRPACGRPANKQSWRLAFASPDRHTVALRCDWEDQYFDYMIQIVRQDDLLLYDTSTWKPISRISLSKRKRTSVAIWHGGSESVVAMLEEGETLRLYRIPDSLPAQ